MSVSAFHFLSAFYCTLQSSRSGRMSHPTSSHARVVADVVEYCETTMHGLLQHH